MNELLIRVLPTLFSFPVDQQRSFTGIRLFQRYAGGRRDSDPFTSLFVFLDDDSITMTRIVTMSHMGQGKGKESSWDGN